MHAPDHAGAKRSAAAALLSYTTNGMPRHLRDMIVVITGASAGIGAALARELSRYGAKLVLSARRAEKLEALNREIGGAHLCVPADVSIPVDCQRLITATIDRFGRIDTLVCNAGYGLIRPVAETSAEDERQIFQTNVFGTTECIRAALPVMQRQEPRDGWRGQIMIVSSAAARRGLPFFGTYSATKAAQLSLAEALRVELKPQRIAVTSVHPVGTETDFFTTAGAQSEYQMPTRSTGEIRQSAQTVARKMVRGIMRPRPEVWPLGPSRWGLSFATLFPGMTDRVMGRARGQLERANAAKGASAPVPSAGAPREG